jgi:dipeptidyl aminopeptidase/acylaminoacyl peptidase
MMQEPVTAPYGSWRSPITAEEIVKGSVRLGQIVVDGADTYWSELRPSEGGRSIIVRRCADETVEDVLASGYSVRTKVHEYGGAAFLVDAGDVWFCNDIDQRIYAVVRDGKPEPLSPEGSYRYADLLVDRRRERLICVREDHSGSGEPENALVAVGFDGKVVVLSRGADFYAAPRLSPNGEDMAWVQWHHPNMPWDETELMLSSVDEAGCLTEVMCVTGEDEAVLQPEFGPDGSLFYVSDRSGWWNLYRLGPECDACVYAIDAEFGFPHWIFGMRTYGFSAPDRIVTAFLLDGISKLAEIDLSNGTMRTIPVPHVDIGGLHAGDGCVCYIGGSMRAPPAVVQVNLENGSVVTIRRSQEAVTDAGVVSIAQPVVFKTADDEVAHGFFYPPINDGFSPVEDERPPLIVKSHGGPTGQTGCSYEAKIQYWTSRGFAVLDVNYRGSTGFGRYYRRLLDGKWGIADMEDCIAGARMLIEQDLVDGARMTITGGSAGGYTTLCALTFADDFKAGASHYGIGDLEALARDTHKFESRYLDRLVGRWPEDQALYVERSPIHHTDGLSCPVIFFQGLDDKVVPPNQAEAMVEALREKGIPVAYIPFEGEGHGFRQAENIRGALESELSFYGQVFGFDPADELEPVEIVNLNC